MEALTSHVEVEISQVEAGWLIFTIYAGQESLRSCFSAPFCPISEFKSWLEAISIGVMQTSFIYDIEGQIISFDYNRMDWKKPPIFTITDDLDNKVLLSAAVDTKQLVRAFYNSFLSFAESDKYNPKEWESDLIKDRLCKVAQADESKLLEALKKLNREMLSRIFFSADPDQSISYPNDEGRMVEFSEFIKQCISGKDNIEYFEAPEGIIVPQDYDSWTIEEKSEFIVQAINDHCSGFGGESLKKIQSEIIEEYLKKS